MFTLETNLLITLKIFTYNNDDFNNPRNIKANQLSLRLQL